MEEFTACLKRSMGRILPIVLSLTPIGFLFGIIAARHDWSILGAGLLSLLGFSGSGQFVFFSLKDQHVGWLLSLGIILMINMRYIPMSITAARAIRGKIWERLVAAHYLCDEAFAIERPEHPKLDRVVARLLIAAFWILGTLAGAISVGFLPPSIAEKLGHISFPASALLTLLALIRAKDFASLFKRRGEWAILLAIVFSSLLYFLIGPRLFWLPSILGTFLILFFGAKTANE